MCAVSLSGESPKRESEAMVQSSPPGQAQAEVPLSPSAGLGRGRPQRWPSVRGGASQGWPAAHLPGSLGGGSARCWRVALQCKARAEGSQHQLHVCWLGVVACRNGGGRGRCSLRGMPARGLRGGCELAGRTAAAPVVAASACPACCHMAGGLVWSWQTPSIA